MDERRVLANRREAAAIVKSTNRRLEDALHQTHARHRLDPVADVATLL
jgi:hypothetical protein